MHDNEYPALPNAPPASLTLRKVTGKRVAMKKVKDIFRDLGDAKRILRELKLLRHFRPHENVVTILDIMVHPENSLDFRCKPRRGRSARRSV